MVKNEKSEGRFKVEVNKVPLLLKFGLRFMCFYGRDLDIVSKHVHLLIKWQYLSKNGQN